MRKTKQTVVFAFALALVLGTKDELGSTEIRLGGEGFEPPTLSV